MKKDIVHLDLFSGAGGFAQGLKQAGFNATKHYFSEIDKHAIANYRHNFKHAQYVGSVTDVRGGELPERPNLITFGSPCQDFSLAGKRQGMDGERSSLILHAIRLITECRPDVFIWENVKGTFSSNNGADFWAIIQAFANIGGYRLEWQLLNTAWVLPQNRERIYLVGHLGNGGGRNVFPFGEDDRLFETERTGRSNEPLPSITATEHKGPSKQRPQNLVLQVRSATSSGYETATEGDSINLSQPDSETRRGRVGKGKAQTLETSCNQEVVCAAMRGRNPENPSSRIKGNHFEQTLEVNQNGTTNTLTAVQKDNLIIQLNPSKESGGNQPYQQNRLYAKEGLAPTIDQAPGKWSVNTPRIRRLTEVECERLQGFSDGWTKYGTNDKGETINISRTQRYKLMGNAVTVNVVQMIGERLIDNSDSKG